MATIRYGEHGAPYVAKNEAKDEEATKRNYLSKEGRGSVDPQQQKRPHLSLVPLDIQESLVRKNRFGGGSPPGYGAHTDEDKLWETPPFRIHPITKKEEAISGIFFRLWPKHVRILQKMKLEGWPHIEIVAVAKELRQRQVAEFQREEQIVQQYIQSAQQDELKEASTVGQFNPEMTAATGGPPPEAMGGLPPEAMGGGLPPEAMGGGLPPEAMGGPPPEAMGGGLPPEAMGGGLPPEGVAMPPGMPFGRSFSFSDGIDYLSQLENFRGKFYSRDVGGGHTFKNLASRAKELKEKQLFRKEKLSKTHSAHNQGFSFGIIIRKAEASFEPELSQVDIKREQEKDWARKKPGVLGMAATSIDLPEKKEST